MIKPKILLQQLWEEGLDWDALTFQTIQEVWKRWCNETLNYESTGFRDVTSLKKSTLSTPNCMALAMPQKQLTLEWYTVYLKVPTTMAIFT